MARCPLLLAAAAPWAKAAPALRGCHRSVQPPGGLRQHRPSGVGAHVCSSTGQLAGWQDSTRAVNMLQSSPLVDLWPGCLHGLAVAARCHRSSHAESSLAKGPNHGTLARSAAVGQAALSLSMWVVELPFCGAYEMAGKLKSFPICCWGFLSATCRASDCLAQPVTATWGRCARWYP